MRRGGYLGGDGQHGLHSRLGVDKRHKLAVYELHLVDFLGDKFGVQLVCDCLGLLGGRGSS